MMKSIPVWKQELSDGVHAARLASLYCCAPAETASEAARYAAVLDGLEKTFGSHAEAGLYSAPGRTEIGGNHTDHQHGRVLAGSVNIDMIAAAAPNDKNQLRVQSEGYDLCVIDLNDLEARKEEENTTAALLRGECAAFTQRGAKLAGLDVYISSNVPKGSGVSSSAAFEVLIGVILNDCFMTEKVSPIAIAQIGQWAENVYFGKPCGLMDQMASSVEKRIAFAFPVFNIERLAGVISIFSASSPREIFLRAIMMSRFTIIAIILFSRFELNRELLFFFHFQSDSECLCYNQTAKSQ